MKLILAVITLSLLYVYSIQAAIVPHEAEEMTKLQTQAQDTSSNG